MGPSDLQGVVLLGEYEVIRHVGGGGMAQVYLARSQKTHERVAVKMLNTEHLRKPNSVKRFEREGRVLLKLHHPNLIRGIAMGEYDKRPVIVMEYVEGPDIAELIEQRGKLSPNESLKLLLDVALALDCLFTTGSIQAHRDIKPSNILITPDGQAKLTDFGIAKALDDDGLHTVDGAQMGTANYMSPEQINSANTADIRTDIYALGAVFYEMLTGEKAFPGSYQSAIMAHFQLEPPSLSGGGALCDPCNHILQKSMAFEPSERYQTPRELIEELAPLVGAEVRVGVPRKMTGAMRLVLVAAAALVVLGAVAAVTLWATSRQPQTPPVSSVRTSTTSNTTSSTSETPPSATNGGQQPPKTTVNVPGVSGGNAAKIDPNKGK